MWAIMSQNGRKMAKMLHKAAKKFDWVDIDRRYMKIKKSLMKNRT